MTFQVTALIKSLIEVVGYVESSWGRFSNLVVARTDSFKLILSFFVLGFCSVLSCSQLQPISGFYSSPCEVSGTELVKTQDSVTRPAGSYCFSGGALRKFSLCPFASYRSP